MGRVLGASTVVRLCETCGHLSTDPLPDLGRYYAEQYQIGLTAEDDDQVYEIACGKPVYRTQHQAQVLVAHSQIAEGERVLDFGCARSTTFKHALPALPPIQLHLYDVSESYRTHWKTLVPAPQQAVDQLPESWTGSFDLVTSFFSLEHVAEPRAVLARIRTLLRPGGRLYAVVPDVHANPGDLLVADHVNHFTRGSLARLLCDARFKVEWIRNDLHRGALVVLATAAQASVTAPPCEPDEIVSARRLAQVWQRLAERVLAVEATAGEPAAIYGAGFYGSFILSVLSRPRAVRCFLDGNPQLHGREHHGRPILPPCQCPAEITSLWVGLNPRQAVRIMGAVDLGRARPRQLFLMEEA